jgi:cysteine-rich repeat protein
VARCGDGVVQDGEACDDGGAVDEDACRSDCAFNSCGDGARNPAEEACDDGNAVNDDACSNDCQTPRCGDQIVQDGEACDDGNIETRDACTNACSIARCGDGILRLEGEECDDGNEVDGDGCSAACAIDRVAVDPNQSAAMASLLSGESQSATLDHVLVTYHNVSNLQEVGFFLQAEAAGPAMFVQVSAAQAGVRAGDIVRLRITRTFPYGGTRRGGAVADVVVLSRDEELAPWTHDISADADVLAERSARASHRVSARLRVDGAMRAAGGNYVSAQISTAGIADEAGFRVRLHRTLQAALYLEPGCVVQVTGVPLIHFQSEAQITPTRLSEVAIVDCPTTTPTALQANATTEVSLAFRRALQADTVAADGSDFAIQGLAISAAAVNAEGIVLTTAPQTEGEVYTLRLVGAVADLAGAAVAMGEFADFRGYRPPAQLRLNELNANAANGCDQLELRVISAGLLRGSIKERTAIVFRFPEVVVAADDLIVLHFDRGDARCTRPTREADQPGNETETKDQFAAADFAANYDTAWDFWAEDRGLTATDNVITVLLDDQIVDGVCVSDAEDGTAAGATETAANTLVAAQGWTAPDGTVPQGGFVDDSFNAAAAQDLNGEGTADSSMSIRRVHPQDRNHRGDWAFGASSFGAVN